MSRRLGVSGTIARKFLTSEITLLLALTGILLGVFAVIVTPREEEPQINVTFANVFIAYPGASAVEVEHLVSTPAEQILSEIDGIEHVYSVSKPGISVLTVQYEVGENRTAAIVRLYNAIYSKQDWLPKNLGVMPPLIKPKGIDDVPILTFTLWTENPDAGGQELVHVAHAIESELKRVKGTRDIYSIGGPDRVVHVQLDVALMSGYGIALEELRATLMASNISREAGSIINNNSDTPVQAGTFLINANDVSTLIVGLSNGNPVYLSDIAQVIDGSDQPEQYVRFATGQAAQAKSISARGSFPAVTVAVAKKPGTNAVEVANNVIERLDQIKGIFIPSDINVTTTRNYGKTAEEKAMQLIGKLAFATAFVVILVLLALGRREAIIVGAAVVITLLLTLFASWAWGFTLNRVSLFALIFSIGILVDDAIVVVENIHRHRQMSDASLLELIPKAVDEVGGPTILATLTVIAALLPMAFVTGLMGPYMSPIPINASLGMAISLAVAFVVTPWLYLKVAKKEHVSKHSESEESESRLYVWIKKYMGPFLNGKRGRVRRWILLLLLLLLIALSVSTVGFKWVVLKMLPFDNKSEIQLVLDMPEGTSVEQTMRVLNALGKHVASVPEVTDYQLYAGTASPINFNGLVRQYYLREGPNVGDIQINLLGKSERTRKSHEIALAMRGPLQEIASQYNANVKVVEVPPGPPVQSPLVAEIYGLDYEGQIKVAKQIREVFESTENIVDVDDSIESNASKFVISVDRQRAASFGVPQQVVVSAIATALSGEDVSYVHKATAKYPVPIRLELPIQDKGNLDTLMGLKVRAADNTLVPLSEITRVTKTQRDHTIYHKDLLPVVFVTADAAGELDSPLYGLFDIHFALDGLSLESQDSLEQRFITQPENPYTYSMKWDGEWQVTYETFRDMGIAYAVGMILIYLLVVSQFKSYIVPIIIMAPIPLTIIGVMPGHALLGVQYTATSMIGMIALAGIIVRNSILLVDFINQQVAQGVEFREAVMRSSAVRSKPIVLTALAAMLGAFFILDDPIFSGLAVSLIFGILVSTLLTLVVIPIMYYAFMYKKFELK